jgi:hypothetical protein
MFENCYVFGQKIPPKGSPTERPDHAEDYPVVKPVTVKPAPKPVPPDPLLSLYRRFAAASKVWGREACDFQIFQGCKDLKPEFFKKIVTDIEQCEAEEKKRLDGIAFGEEFDRQCKEEMLERYLFQGKEIVENEQSSNTRR